MELNFTKVSFDGDLDDIEDADELRGIISDFQSAQESNISEFQDAKDTLGDFEGRVAEAEEFKGELAESLAEVSPLSSEEALTYDMARIRELLTEFSEEEDDAEDADDGQFSDMGQKGETHNGDAASEFAEEQLGDIDGLNI